MTMQELSENTKKAYGIYVKAFEAHLDGKKPALEEAQAFLDGMKERGARQNTIGVAGRAIRRVFNIPVPVPNIEMLEPEYLTVDQINKLIEKAPTLLEKTLIILVFSTGCRISEILNLTKGDLEMEKGVVTVTRKGGQRQRIPLGTQGTEALKTWLKERKSTSQRVFMDYNYSHIRYRFQKLGKKAKIPEFHAHILRHSRARHLSQSGVPMERVSEILGHRKLDTTQKIYGSLRAEDRAKYLKVF